MAKASKGGRKGGKKEKKNVPHAIAHIRATFNNTIITIADPAGNVISWASSGAQGFKGSRKGTPFAAQTAAQTAARAARDNGAEQIEFYDELPYNETGKLLRRKVRAQFMAG